MRTLRTILITGLCAALLTACGKQEEAESTATPPGPQAGPAMGEEAESALGAAAEAAKEKAQEALAAFKREYAAQLETQQSKVDALKATAQALSDDKLSGLLGSLDEKLAAARTKIGDITSADEGAAEAMKKEITDLMAEIPKLYEQAMARFNELKGVQMPETPGAGDLPGLPGG
jgi:hypothetical protein